MCRDQHVGILDHLFRLSFLMNAPLHRIATIVLVLCYLVFAPFSRAAVAANNLILTQRNAANDNNTTVYVTATADRLLGFNSASPAVPGIITLGNLTLSSGALNLSNTAVTAAAYGSSTASPQITFDAKGRASAAANVTITPAVGSITGLGSGVATALAATPNATGGIVTFSGNIGAATAMSVNGLTLISSTGTLSITNAKVFAVTNNLTLSGTDGSTLNVGAGGTLGTAAFTAASAYEVPLTFSTGLTRTVNTVTVNTAQNIAKLSGLTTNGLVTTSGGDGTLGVTVPGTSVLTALGVNIGSAGAFVVNGGALGTPASGNVTAALPAFTGDATSSAGAAALTLATVNSNVGTFGSATASPAVTLNAKGQVTAGSNVTITPAVGSITGLGTGVATYLATPTIANLLAATAQVARTDAANTFTGTQTISTISAAAATNLVLNSGSSGTSLTLGQGSAGVNTFGANSSGNVDNYINKTATTNYGLFRFRTGGADKWLFGSRETGSDDRFNLYSYGFGGDVMTVAQTTGVVAFLGTTAASSSTTGTVIIGSGTAATTVGIGGGLVYAGAGFFNQTARINTATAAYGAGTAYSLTNTAAAIDFGTTDPSVTIPSTGTYTISGAVNLFYNAATFAGNQSVTLKFRRTNNTAADLTNGAMVTTTQVITALTYTYGVFRLPDITYAATAGDVITIFADVSATPGAGSLDAVASGTYIRAKLDQ